MWEYDTHPAIADLPAKTRQGLIAAARRRMLAPYRIWFHCIAIWIILTAVSLLLYLMRWPGSRVLFWISMAPLAAAAMGICSAAVRSRGQFPVALQQEMMSQGIWPTACLFCGYTMRGIRGDECPECGAKLSARGSDEPQAS